MLATKSMGLDCIHPTSYTCPWLYSLATNILRGSLPILIEELNLLGPLDVSHASFLHACLCHLAVMLPLAPFATTWDLRLLSQDDCQP